MYASTAGSLLAFSSLLFSNTASAGPAVPRAVTEGPLDPWVSVDASGNAVATITPFISTVNGVATTVNAAPATLIATTTTSQSGSKPTETSVSTGGGSYQVCHNLDGDFAPLCKPDNGTAIYVGQTYYVTWDATYFAVKNATVIIVANYLNSSNGGQVAFSSAMTGAAAGFYVWTIEKGWLQGLGSNNITLWINPLNPTDGEAHSLGGLNLEVTNKPVKYYHPPPTSAPTGQSLYIALPTVFGFIILCVCGGAIINRKHRKIGLGNVMGRRNGYGVGKSRSQRLGLRKKKDGAIQLRDQELTAGGQYRDAPLPQERERPFGHARADSDALGSLAGTPTEERTNYFGDEMQRQERSRY
ncbi:hypothetical protein N431DRAFT_347489 [Stipitochalara longipes BDJ]|nr:hypothetical protein N431DRAFT_347489 [Stipitochalara longipes BDJ]